MYDKHIIIIGTRIEKEQNIIFKSMHTSTEEKQVHPAASPHKEALISPVRSAEPDHCCCSPSPSPIGNALLFGYLSIHVHIGNALLFGEYPSMSTLVVQLLFG